MKRHIEGVEQPDAEKTEPQPSKPPTCDGMADLPVADEEEGASSAGEETR
ncbi:hypothetical protein [Mycobacterium sp. 141]|nr:hypothetical protein [Mycobacterium sp. 141]